MKIHSLTSSGAGYSYRVVDKEDTQFSGQSPDHKSDQESKKSFEEEFDEAMELTAQKLEEAVDSFQSDSLTQANKLNASVCGAGPGLIVVLKDESGGLVRQLTGAEFLRLRDAANKAGKDGQIRGKILDQKL